jgi:hypothetical protein
MISRSTVLILGAGSSVHCGYPLGGELIANICRKQAKATPDDIGPFDSTDVEAFVRRLSRSGHYSIDAFLADAGDQIELGKFLIARELKRIEDLDRLFPPNNSGWYQYFFNQLLVDGKPEFARNKIAIITFNYDRSLEAYLHTATMNRFGMTAEVASQALSEIPIVHVHGVLGEYPAVPYANTDSADELLAISKGIQIIHEIEDRIDGFCSDAFEKSSGLLSDAERIFFLGFGFHHDNINRFRFFQPENLVSKEILSTTHRMQSLDHESVPKRLEPFGIPKEAFPHNSASCDLFFSRTAYLE